MNSGYMHQPLTFSLQLSFSFCAVSYISVSYREFRLFVSWLESGFAGDGAVAFAPGPGKEGSSIALLPKVSFAHPVLVSLLLALADWGWVVFSDMTVIVDAIRVGQLVDSISISSKLGDFIKNMWQDFCLSARFGGAS